MSYAVHLTVVVDTEAQVAAALAELSRSAAALAVAGRFATVSIETFEEVEDG